MSLIVLSPHNKHCYVSSRAIIQPEIFQTICPIDEITSKYIPGHCSCTPIHAIMTKPGRKSCPAPAPASFSLNKVQSIEVSRGSLYTRDGSPGIKYKSPGQHSALHTWPGHEVRGETSFTFGSNYVLLVSLTELLC